MLTEKEIDAISDAIRMAGMCGNNDDDIEFMGGVLRRMEEKLKGAAEEESAS